MASFLINDTRKQLYHDAQTDPLENSARALALKVLELGFTDEKYYRNSEFTVRTINGEVYRPDYVVMESVPAGIAPNRRGVVVVCDEVKTNIQTERQDEIADEKMGDYGRACLDYTPGQSICFVTRQIGTKIRFWKYTRINGLEDWGDDYLDVEDDWGEIMNRFAEMQAQNLF